MPSEPDSTPRRRPPTIDLTATEVENKASAQEGGGADARHGAEEGRRATSDRSNAGRLRQYALSAAAGAMVTAALIAALWFAGVLPNQQSAPVAGAAPQPAAMNEISARLGNIEGTLQSRPPPEVAPNSRLTTEEAQTKSLADQVLALNRRVDDVAVATQGALAQAKAATAASAAADSAARTSVQKSDLDALAGRIAALERAVKSLSADVARGALSADDHAARAALAAAALRSAVERGVPYQAELAALAALTAAGANQNAMAALRPFAVGGVPSPATLAQELAQLTPALMRASGAEANEGTFFERLKSNAQKLVRITPINAPPGDDPPAVIARIDAAAARADIAGALSEIARLPAAARGIAEPWAKKAEARAAAMAASQQMVADALSALGTPNVQ
ncbi:MAG TPA: mitofilin family membrane protein [Xanthobacteraceae bacterium]|jgi:hypothetical protein